jgi:O-antigen biosynthesis protein
MNRLTIRGKYLYEGGQKFFARGVSYGPFPPNSRGERYPEPPRTAADFALMRQLGVNLVRTYVPPPEWLFELARQYELRLMVGMPWPFHMAFLDSKEMMRDIRDTIGDGVRAMQPHRDVIFAYSLGNEIRSDIVRWHGARAVSRFLHELYDLGKQRDPAGLFTYSNYPSAEYLELNFLDLVCFNIYLHREADFRRYLTHLLATTGDRPLVLSETGMDTIREGEAHQAELLRWQARATFELGLSGFIVFAFTDEWHTGGAEITDWAFGLVTRDRRPKAAFTALTDIYRGELPPPLRALPKASVVVCAYNAAATLGACLDSLKHLNYADYEVIVVDDGSRDGTATVAAEAGVRLLQLEHGGLGAARNAGLAAARGRIVAFIDADAEADRDWLYHLSETLIRRGVVAAGGQNFPPSNGAAWPAAIAAAPGEPREVRAGDDTLDQVCGCSMALDKTRSPEPAPFDPYFTTAGDDVDFSWRMRERGLELAYAAGAVVIHRRRATIAAYIRQQVGYGRAEAALARRYPDRIASGDNIYNAGNGWIARWLGSRSRVYYGAFGRGLFQSLYQGSRFPPLLQIPLSFWWPGLASILLLLGLFASRGLAIAGIVGLLATAASAQAIASYGRVSRRLSRARLVVLCLAGPIARSYARDLGGRNLWRGFTDDRRRHQGRLRRSGTIVVELAGDVAELTEALRAALFRRGATVAVTDGYQPYDLQLRAGYLGADINLRSAGAERVIGWKIATRGVAVKYAGILLAIVAAAVIALLGRESPLILPLVIAMWLAGAAASWIWLARIIPAVLESAVEDVVASRRKLAAAAAGAAR